MVILLTSGRGRQSISTIIYKKVENALSMEELFSKSFYR